MSVALQQPFTTGEEVRLACRREQFSSVTSGLAPGYVQANLIVLPSKYASEFRLLCQRNPVPCPLLAESHKAGDFATLKSWVSGVADSLLVADLDLQRDCPKYMIYEDGEVAKTGLRDATAEWTSDHVAFLIGCSYSFETALAAAGLVPPHVKHGRNVSMYRTNIALQPAGVFQNSTYVVSMRLYRQEDLERVRAITRPFIVTHGEPVAWGWDGAKRIGIGDICRPEWGDAPVCDDGHVLEDVDAYADGALIPVFWGCGVTPQAAVVQAGLKGTVIAHSPGHMLLLDIRDHDILPRG